MTIFPQQTQRVSIHEKQTLHDNTADSITRIAFLNRGDHDCFRDNGPRLRRNQRQRASPK